MAVEVLLRRYVWNDLWKKNFFQLFIVFEFHNNSHAYILPRQVLANDILLWLQVPEY
jgi:hypothetical protein